MFWLPLLANLESLEGVRAPRRKAAGQGPAESHATILGGPTQEHVSRGSKAVIRNLGLFPDFLCACPQGFNPVPFFGPAPVFEWPNFCVA
jgi:hypothetical protein